MERKGFPESYDTRRLLGFLRDVKSGADEVRAPVYSHVVYDIVPARRVVVRQPDILILEGLNVLQRCRPSGPSSSATTSTSRSTSTPRSPTSRSGTCSGSSPCASTVFQDPNSFFRHYAGLTDEEAGATAARIWETINGRNLRGEHPADPRAGVTDHPQGGRPPRLVGAAAQVVGQMGTDTSWAATAGSPMTSTTSS